MPQSPRPPSNSALHWAKNFNTQNRRRSVRNSTGIKVHKLITILANFVWRHLQFRTLKMRIKIVELCGGYYFGEKFRPLSELSSGNIMSDKFFYLFVYDLRTCTPSVYTWFFENISRVHHAGTPPRLICTMDYKKTSTAVMLNRLISGNNNVNEICIAICIMRMN